jgi:hypothetical protein
MRRRRRVCVYNLEVFHIELSVLVIHQGDFLRFKMVAAVVVVCGGGSDGSLWWWWWWW